MLETGVRKSPVKGIFRVHNRHSRWLVELFSTGIHRTLRYLSALRQAIHHRIVNLFHLHGPFSKLSADIVWAGDTISKRRPSVGE